MSKIRPWLRDLFKSPRNAAIESIVADMDRLAAESRRTVVRCEDCRSTNVLAWHPDGTVGYFGTKPPQVTQ